jgi:hypothetical protein
MFMANSQISFAAESPRIKRIYQTHHTESGRGGGSCRSLPQDSAQINCSKTALNVSITMSRAGVGQMMEIFRLLLTAGSDP